MWPPFEASIEYGVGGVNTKNVMVDFTNGATVSIVASYVRVFAVITQANFAGGTNAAYTLSAHLGPGVSDTHAQRTIFMGDVPDESFSDIFAVPLYAKSVVPYAANNHPAPLNIPIVVTGWIRFLGGTLGILGPPVTADFFFNSNNPIPIPIPNQSFYFEIYNESGTNLDFGAIFNLAP
jgi:hypothetical protein